MKSIRSCFIIALTLLASSAYAWEHTDLMSTEGVVTVRCSTNNAGGNFSIFYGRMDAYGLVGTLSRGFGGGTQNPQTVQFQIVGTPVTSSNETVSAYQVAGNIALPNPGTGPVWETPTFQFQKALFKAREGGMIEKGRVRNLNTTEEYEFEYKCVAK